VAFPVNGGAVVGGVAVTGGIDVVVTGGVVEVVVGETGT